MEVEEEGALEVLLQMTAWGEGGEELAAHQMMAWKAAAEEEELAALHHIPEGPWVGVLYLVPGAVEMVPEHCSLEVMEAEEAACQLLEELGQVVSSRVVTGEALLREPLEVEVEEVPPELMDQTRCHDGEVAGEQDLGQGS